MTHPDAHPLPIPPLPICCMSYVLICRLCYMSIFSLCYVSMFSLCYVSIFSLCYVSIFSLCYVRFLVCVMCLFLVCVMCLFLAWRASLRSAGARFARGGVPGWAEVHRHQPPGGDGTGGTNPPPLGRSMHIAYVALGVF